MSRPETTVPPRETPTDGLRSYEVFQRQRVGESTPLVRPRALIGSGFLADPHPILAVLREEYPCYRDWIGNAFWITRYDDVTSVLVDDANFETRTRRWSMDLAHRGRDLGRQLPVREAEAAALDAHARPDADRLVADLAASDRPDLARGLAARLPLVLLGRTLDLPDADLPAVAAWYWRMQRGSGADPVARHDGVAAFGELAAFLDPLVEKRRADPGDDLISAAAALEIEGGPVTGVDVAATLLEGDHQTLHGGLANLWALLLTHPDQLEAVAGERRLVRSAWLEALRFEAPVTAGRRFARHEVERFGRLLPEGALMVCSAAAANRDPRQFAHPDRFDLFRKDLCQREPRGQYRADGLPSGVSVGTGAPSRWPAEPQDRPRSRYALTRDVAVAATNAVLDGLPAVRSAPGAEPELRSLRHGEMRTCWHLPVVHGRGSRP